MPSRPHPPSQMRAILQEWKRGRPARDLLGEARSIADASFAAEALFALATDPALTDAEAERAALDALRLAASVERAWRQGEALAGMAARLAELRRNHAAGAHKPEAILVDGVLRLPAKERGEAIVAIAPEVSPDQLRRLAGAAVGLDHALPAGKAVLKAAIESGHAADVLPAFRGAADGELRARLLGAWAARMAATQPEESQRVMDEALDAAAALGEPAVRLDVVRAVVAACEALAPLRVVHGWAQSQDDEAGARTLSALGARADRIGHRAEGEVWLKEAVARAARIGDDRARDSVQRNVQEGLRRMGVDAGLPTPAAATAGSTPTTSTPGTQGPGLHAGPGARATIPRPAAGSSRHVLALYDSYEGGLGDVHLRAVARAAPLCDAFDLDLALVGFPAKDLEAFVKRAGRETNIGEGRKSLERLHRDGRLHLVACEKGAMPDVSPLGTPVATTPSPDPAKATTEFPPDAGRLVVLVGLGPKGLPEGVLGACRVHVEVTGRRISLETATAMGVLAERLRAPG